MSSGVSDGWDRWNTHWSVIVEQDVFGLKLRLYQDPNSQHLGTTVWDASIVLAKFFEKNVRKGEFSRPKVQGKRAIELGAGMGLGGMTFAMLGADVVLTDVVDVLPLLKKNYETNLCPATLRGTDLRGCVGKVTVRELDWKVPEHVADAQPPFDFILAADCVYHEQIVEDFHRTVIALSGPKTTVLVCNELRSESVHSRFLELFSASHTIKRVPAKQLDEVFNHSSIDIFLMKLKKPGKGGVAAAGSGSAAAEQPGEEEGAADSAHDGEGAALPGGCSGHGGQAATTSGCAAGPGEEGTTALCCTHGHDGDGSVASRNATSQEEGGGVLPLDAQALPDGAAAAVAAAPGRAGGDGAATLVVAPPGPADCAVGVRAAHPDSMSSAGGSEAAAHDLGKEG